MSFLKEFEGNNVPSKVWVETQMACLPKKKTSELNDPDCGSATVTRCNDVVVFTLSLYTLALMPGSPSVPYHYRPP